MHPAPGALPSAAAAPTAPPNIVLVLTDDQRWDTLWSQPVVQANLVDHGTTFTQAFVENPLCCPSRVTILTGQLSHTTGIYGNGNGFAKFRASALDRSTIATWLHAAGYRTALMGKYVNGYCAADAAYVPPGWDRWLVFTGPAGDCGQGGYYGFTLSNDGRRQSIPATGPYSTDYLAEKAVSFVRGTGASRPLFLMLSTKTPHSPYTPPRRYASAFPGLPAYDPPSFNEADVSDKPAWVRAVAPWTPAQVQAKQVNIRKSYQSLLSVDDAVSSVTDALAATGRLRNTVVIYMGDNGEQLGEHRLRGKNAPYTESIRIPLVIRDYRLDGTARIDGHLVWNADIAQTIAAAAGVAAPGAEGASLVPLVAGERPPWRTDELAEHIAAAGGISPTFCEVHSAAWAYTQYSTGEEELYDLAADPFELTNVAQDPAAAATLAAERAHLHELCRPPPPGFVFSH